MGIFTSQDRNGYTEIHAGRAVGAGLAAVLATAAAVDSLVLISPREADVITDFNGAVIQVMSKPGTYYKIPFLHGAHSYDLRRDSVKVDESALLRTSDYIRLKSPFTVEYEIDENTDVTKLYIDLRGKDPKDLILQRARDVAVQVYETLTVSDLANHSITEKIKAAIKDKLQKTLNEQGWPIKIMTVNTTGFNLMPESEGELQKIVNLRQEAARLQIRQENAEKSLQVLALEAKTDGAYMKGLLDAGVPKENLVCALYIKRLAEAGKIGIPLVAGCHDQGVGVAVAVPAPGR